MLVASPPMPGIFIVSATLVNHCNYRIPAYHAERGKLFIYFDLFLRDRLVQGRQPRVGVRSAERRRVKDIF